MMGTRTMRSAIAMIELIFAIAIISISVISIPVMISIADKAAKGVAIDDDVMARLSGWTMEKFQARWDGNYSASDSLPLNIAGVSDLNCTRPGGYRWGSDENISSMQCDMNPWNQAIPNPSLDGNLSKGIEQLNGGTEPITITPTGGTPYEVNATYSVAYVDSTVGAGANANSQTATWRLGSSAAMNPNPFGATTHLKRVVTRFSNPATDTDVVLTFFKSNKGN